jgi:hypothetical protein
VVDAFNRPNETLSDLTRWTNGIIGSSESGLNVTANTLACSLSTTCTAWRNATQYGPDAEAWAKITTLPGTGNAIRLYVRLQQPGSTSFRGYMLRTNQVNGGTDQVYLERWNPGNSLTTLLTMNQELAVGDTLLLRDQGTMLEAWRNNGTSWSRLGAVTDATYSAAGFAGVGMRGSTGRLDDFGARTMGSAPPTVPDPPTSLTATAGTNQVTLNWSAPANNGGSGISGYKIYRATASGAQVPPALATVSGAATTTYVDSSGTPGTTYFYKVAAVNGVGDSVLSNEASAAPTPPAPPPKPLYFSLLNDGIVGGLSVANEDVVSYNGTSFSLAFDGSDVGLASRRIDAFGWLNANTLLFSLDTDGATLPGVSGTIDDSDVIRFNATSLGTTTSGSFSMYFDGSDVGLTTSAEDVDAFEALSNGNLIFSTAGSASVTGVSAGDEDLLQFTPTSLGSTTAGTWTMYFDGSDVGLSASGENVDAAAVDAAGRIYLSTTGGFSVPGVSGGDEDVFVFNPTTIGASTSGTFSSSLYFDGSAFGLGGNDISAIDLPPGT